MLPDTRLWVVKIGSALLTAEGKGLARDALSSWVEPMADWVLSGHTHGGHVGLLSLGLQGTAIRWISRGRVPDHGPWVGNGNLLYVHRATGHYGFPLRLGVPAEESVLELWWPGVPAPAVA